MPIRLPFPELLYPYSPVAKPMPPPPISEVCEGDQVCVSFSCSLIPYLLGLLEIYRYKDSFTGTDEEKTIAVGVMRQLMEVLAMGCGCGDDNDKIVIHRIDPITGQVQESEDDGETWTTDPQSPYVQAVEQRPLSGADSTIKQCEAANNVIGNMMDLQSTYSDMIGTFDSLDDLIIEIIIVAAGMLFLPLLGQLLLDTLSPLIGKVFDLGKSLIGADQTAYDAMFSEGNWTIARCILYCHGHEDGKYTQADWSAIISDMKDQLGAGYNQAGANMAQMIDFWGLQGLNNAARVGAGTEGNCDDCDCVDEGDWWYEFDFETASFGSYFSIVGGDQGHYVPGTGYMPNTIGGAVWCTIFGNFIAQDMHLIGWIVEHTIDGLSQFNRGIPFNATNYNLDSVNQNIVDGSEAWAAESGGAISVTEIGAKWTGAPDSDHLAVVLKRLVLHGQGTNPFGSDNYHYDPMNP